jgi:hypothetical protein
MWNDVGALAVDRNDLIDNDLERPWLEQVQTDPAKREQQSKNRLRPERPVITKNAPIDRHGGISDCGLQVFELLARRLGSDAEAKSEIQNLKSEILRRASSS